MEFLVKTMANHKRVMTTESLEEHIPQFMDNHTVL